MNEALTYEAARTAAIAVGEGYASTLPRSSEAGDHAMTKTTVSSTELAKILGTDTRSCRRFLRRQFPDLVGQPGNWEVDAELLDQLKTIWDLQHPKLPVLPVEEAHKRAAVV